MELFLNLVWLGVSLVITLVAIARAGRETAWAQRCVIGVAALCLLVLLFPVISMSDDLQQVSFMAEENIPGRNLPHLHAAPAAHLQFAITLAILLIFEAALVARGLAGTICTPCSPLSGFRTLVNSRPPPFLSFR
jgi:hypothetical protein